MSQVPINMGQVASVCAKSTKKIGYEVQSSLVYTGCHTGIVYGNSEACQSGGEVPKRVVQHGEIIFQN